MKRDFELVFAVNVVLFAFFLLLFYLFAFNLTAIPNTVGSACA